VNILFLCTANLNRSRTAESYFSELHKRLNFRSAGLSKKYCSKNDTVLCSVADLQWADKIFVMETMHKERIFEHTGETYLNKISVLNIPDVFKFGDDELISMLIERVNLPES
jgi:predicted protein tyrosine phosphatase